MTAARRSADHTRNLLLDAAFDELYRQGYRAMRLDVLLDRLGLTKGALYHHFRSKADLGHAVIEERLRPWIEATWRPVLGAPDVVGAALELCRQLTAERCEQVAGSGCPLTSLLHELRDEPPAFLERLQAVIDDWYRGIVTGLRQGQSAGTVRRDVDPEDAAAFILSAIEGSGGLAGNVRGADFLQAAMRGLIDYLQSLKPQRSS